MAPNVPPQTPPVPSERTLCPLGRKQVSLPTPGKVNSRPLLPELSIGCPAGTCRVMVGLHSCGSRSRLMAPRENHLRGLRATRPPLSKGAGHEESKVQGLASPGHLWAIWTASWTACHTLTPQPLTERMPIPDGPLGYRRRFSRKDRSTRGGNGMRGRNAHRRQNDDSSSTIRTSSLPTAFS